MHGSQWFPHLVNGNPGKLKKNKNHANRFDLPAIQSGPNPPKCNWIGCAILKANHKQIRNFFQFSRIRSSKVIYCKVPCILLTYFLAAASVNP